MKKLRFAVMGCGFWAKFQIGAWMELKEHVELIALYNRTLSKAEHLADCFNVPAVYDDPQKLLDNEELDFIDIITDVDTHPVFTKMAAERGINVICQKPMAPTFQQARAMMESCKSNKVDFYIHENFRWQKPVRVLKEKLTSGIIGKPFKANVSFCNSFPVFDNQPFLAELEQFIITDLGSHILDVSRSLFGEAKSLYCKTQRVNPNIRGEDVANVFMEMDDGVHCYAEMSYASILEKERFPQTYVLIEGDKGSLYLGPDFEISTTTKTGTTKEIVEPTIYDWVDPDYAVVHSSIFDCNQDILLDMLGKKEAETTGEDNFKTIQLVFDSYQSAAENSVINY
ncbi:Gfo/Idh/MocA family protein [Flexithrix dorotheae]|uniref:Gfo/Idh/MocA family protein n=1 Tax=Flexithrix dorotheae TaxID=70993 RepID=UPI0004774180|nr:Gfo/Idh/MocA family oxidoreductase [Flexithrix dorotheae]